MVGRSRHWRWYPPGIVALLGLALCGFPDVRAPLEYQVKAAFLYNFAKFVEWPAAAATPTVDKVTIGVIGDDPFGGILDETLEGKTCCRDKPLVASRIQKLEHAANCHVLFISASEESRLPEILTTLHGASVLTVSDIDHFVDRGGMIGFRRDGNKVRFEINSDAAARAGLTISSQLLKLATRVISKPDNNS